MIRSTLQLAVLALGALASLATSAPNWAVDEEAPGPTVVLTATKPSAIVPITVMADGFEPGTEALQLQIIGAALTDGPDLPGPHVRVMAREVASTDPAEEQTVDSGPSDRNHFYVQLWLDCQQPCAHEVEVTFESYDLATSTESEVQWSARLLALGYESNEPPAGLDLTLTVRDPQP